MSNCLEIARLLIPCAPDLPHNLQEAFRPLRKCQMWRLFSRSMVHSRRDDKTDSSYLAYQQGSPDRTDVDVQYEPEGHRQMMYLESSDEMLGRRRHDHGVEKTMQLQ